MGKRTSPSRRTPSFPSCVSGSVFESILPSTNRWSSRCLARLSSPSGRSVWYPFGRDVPESRSGGRVRGAVLPTIGWREYVDFPEWGIRRVRAKVDTGAKTSSVDAFDISEVVDGYIEFHVVQSRHPRQRTKLARAKLVRHTVIKNSMGQAEHRYVVRTLARVGEYEFALELTLVARPRLLCRMLIGRSALDGRFLVDCAHKYVVTRRRAERRFRKARVSSAAKSSPHAGIPSNEPR